MTLDSEQQETPHNEVNSTDAIALENGSVDSASEIHSDDKSSEHLKKDVADSNLNKKKSKKGLIIGIAAIVIVAILIAVIAIPKKNSSNDETTPKPITISEFTEIANDLGYDAESVNNNKVSNADGAMIAFDEGRMVVFLDFDTVKDAYAYFTKLDLEASNKGDATHEINVDDSGYWGDTFNYAYYSSDYNETITYYLNIIQYENTVMFCEGLSESKKAFDEIVEKSGYAKVRESKLESAQAADAVYDEVPEDTTIDEESYSSRSDTVDPIYADASSQHDNMGEISYAPYNVIDGDLSTAWVEGVDGDGKGEWISVTFDNERPIEAIRIMNGYQNTQETYATNNRVKDAIIEFEDGSREKITLHDDIAIEQIVVFSEEKSGNTIKLIIQSAYLSHDGNDTCITEIGLLESGMEYPSDAEVLYSERY